MPYIICTLKYPSHKQMDVVNTWVKIANKYPNDDAMAVQLGSPVSTTENGICLMPIFEVKEGQLEKALKYYSKFYYEFINIEGFEYTVKVWMTFDEALEVGKIQRPE